MRVCIPTMNDAGMSARVSPHFGRAPCFTVVDVETARARAIPNALAEEPDRRCSAGDVLADEAIDVVLCQSIGPTASARLRARGVEIVFTQAATVADALRELRSRRS